MSGTCYLPGDMMASGPGLQLGAMSGFMALLQPGLMSVTPVAIEGYADSKTLGLHLGW